MRSVTIKDAKAHLNELVERAIAGEEVVLMRGSKHVAALVPISEDDLELVPRITDDQVDRLRGRLAAELASGRTRVFDSAGAAAAYLRRSARRSPARRRRRRG